MSLLRARCIVFVLIAVIISIFHSTLVYLGKKAENPSWLVETHALKNVLDQAVTESICSVNRA